MNSPKNEHYPFIDALRGIAALLVVAAHTSRFYQPSSHYLSVIASAGNRGVQLFYIVSSFTLCLALSRSSETAPKVTTLKRFWVHRFFRIIPMFYFAIGLSLLIVGKAPRYWAPDGISNRDIALTFSFLNAWDPGSVTSIVEGGWSVALEMNYYLFFPAIFTFCRSRLTTFAALGSSVGLFYTFRYFGDPILLNHWSPETRYLPAAFVELLSLPAELPIFVLGILLFKFWRSIEGKLRGHRSSPFLGYTLIVLAAGIFYWVSTMPYHLSFPRHFEHSLTLVVFFLGLAIHPTRILVNPLARYLGKLSFSIYLMHNYAIMMVNHIVAVFNERGHSLQLPFGLAYVTVILTTLLLSVATFHLIENPCRIWGYKWWERQRVAL